MRERDGDKLVGAGEGDWLRRAARDFAWSPGWERRYLECAAQRGLKVVGTFLRLAAAGKPDYRRFLPEVRENAAAALRRLGAPLPLVDATRGNFAGEGV